MEKNSIEDKTLITKIDKAIKDIDNEIELISRLDNRVESEARSFIIRILNDYADANRRIILGDEQGSKDLINIYNSITKNRIKFLSTAIINTLDRVKDTVTSPLWFGDQNTYLTKIDEYKEELKKMQEDEKDDIEHALKLRERFKNANNILKQTEREKHRAQNRTPWKIVFWGTPILVGIFISGKFSYVQNLIFIGMLLTIVVISHLMLKYISPSKFTFMSRKRKNKKSGTKRFGLKSAVLTGLLFPIIMIILFGFSWLVPSLFIKSHMKFVINTKPITVSQGENFEIPYSVIYTGKQVVFDVKIANESPGLLINIIPESYNVIGNKEEKGNIKVDIPINIPDGRYFIKTICSFKTKGKWYEFDVFNDFKKRNHYSVSKIIDILVRKRNP